MKTLEPKTFLQSKGTDYTLNYPVSRQKEIEEWMDEYKQLLAADQMLKALQAIERDHIAIPNKAWRLMQDAIGKATNPMLNNMKKPAE
jgi:hypothetical protein